MSEVVGASDLSLKFRKLKLEMIGPASRRITSAGGRVVVAAGKTNARAAGLVKSGALVKNIVLKREPGTPPGTAQIHIGVRHGRNLTKKQKVGATFVLKKDGRIRKVYKDDPFYWSFLEFTTVKRTGTPYLGPALSQNVATVLAAMSERLDKELQVTST